MKQHRQLAAILFTDIVGYTAMMQQDETKTVAIVKHYVTILKEVITEHKGEILNDYGDGTLCTLPSATAAIRAAIKLQHELIKDPKVPLRIGIHLGEVFFEEGKVMGESVNVASRIQSLGQPNTVLISRDIYDKIKNQPDFKPLSLGKFHFKSVDQPMEVFALANEGLQVPKRERMQGKLERKGSMKRTLLITIACLVVGILSFFIYKNFFKTGIDDSKEKSVAIIPFKVSGQGDELSNGLVEDILVRLMKIKDLKVISNRSSIQYAGSQKSSKEIGEELSVNSLIFGNIQQIGDRIRVTAQLIESKSGKMIWTEIYDRDKVQIFDLQAELATQIVDALKTNLTPEEKRDLSSRNTGNIEAYKLYRKGRLFLDRRTTASFDSAQRYFKGAIELDPDYALPYVGLADVYSLPQNGMTQVEAMPIAKNYSMKALSLDSTLGEALATLGFIQSAFEYDWAGSKSTLEKAIALNPNYSIAHRYYGNLLLYAPGYDVNLAFKEVRKAVELDPLSSAENWVLGRNYYFAGKIDSAYEQLRKTIALDSQNIRAKGSLGAVLLAKKKYTEAIAVLKQLPRSGTSRTFNYQGPLLSYAYAVSNDTARARYELMTTIKESPDQSPYTIAIAYIGLKEYDKALAALEQAYKIRDINLYFIGVQPELNPIRKDPRFIALLKKMNLQ